MFRLFFNHTCTFYPGNTYKCQKTVFTFFFKQLKELIHTCTFYSRNTYKCAVTVFTIKKNLMKIKRKLRTLQGMILDDFLDLWLPFGTLWFPCGSLWLPFGSLRMSNILFYFFVFVRFWQFQKPPNRLRNFAVGT